MKKVLVIGGTGTISSPITRKLANDPDVKLYMLNRGQRKDEFGDKVERLIGDIRNEKEKVKKLIQDLHFDTVIDFIIMKPEEAKDRISLFKGKCDQFIFISTVCVLNHSVSCLVDETMPYGNAYYQYGRDKEECEKIFLKAQAEGFPVTIVRPTQTYSDGRYPLSIKGKTYWSVASRMLRGKEVIVHGDGQNLWACTHAEDFSKFFMPLIGNKKTIGEIYQIMDPRPYTWDMIYQALAKALGVEYKPVYISEYLLDASKTYDFHSTMHGDKHFSCIFDITKIKEIAKDAVPEIDIEEGARRYVAYMNSHPEEKKEDEDFDRWCDETIANYKKFAKEFTEKL